MHQNEAAPGTNGRRQTQQAERDNPRTHPATHSGSDFNGAIWMLFGLLVELKICQGTF